MFIQFCDWIKWRHKNNESFQRAELPDEVIQILKVVLDEITVPKAVRSSSLLEDSKYQPFAGVYSTYMLPNNNLVSSFRLKNLVAAIKRIYASVYSPDNDVIYDWISRSGIRLVSFVNILKQRTFPLADKLSKENWPYILISVGRWGTADPWLGIPVNLDQISGAWVIIETSFTDLVVEPSQGSHFFHNLTALSVGYFSVKVGSESSWIDWEWLNSQSNCLKGKFINHLQIAEPLIVKMNSYINKGVIYKPNDVI